MFILSHLRRELAHNLQLKPNTHLCPLLRLPLFETIVKRLALNSYSTSSSMTEMQDRQHSGSKELATREEWADQRFLYRLHICGPKMPRKARHPLQNQPQMKGIVLKTLIKKPKKPNSANRKCVLVRLRTGKEVTVFVPGEGHNLQEHSVVLVEKKRVRDVPGLQLRVIRGAYDCAHVIKKTRTPA